MVVSFTVNASFPAASTLSFTSKSLAAETAYAVPLPSWVVKAIPHGLAKKSLILPASGVRAPRCKFNTPASNGVVLFAPAIMFTKAWVSRLKRNGPVGEAAMFGK